MLEHHRAPHSTLLNNLWRKRSTAGLSRQIPFSCWMQATVIAQGLGMSSRMLSAGNIPLVCWEGLNDANG